MKELAVKPLSRFPAPLKEPVSVLLPVTSGYFRSLPVNTLPPPLIPISFIFFLSDSEGKVQQVQEPPTCHREKGKKMKLLLNKRASR